MKKYKFKIEGLDCANCANELEESIQKLEGVVSVSISFLTLKMILEVDVDDFEEFLDRLKKLVKKEEPDVEITLL